MNTEFVKWFKRHGGIRLIISTLVGCFLIVLPSLWDANYTEALSRSVIIIFAVALVVLYTWFLVGKSEAK